MDMSSVTEFLSAGKTLLDIFKGVRKELPPGPKTEQVQQKIEEAEKALRASEAQLAKVLGYRLCQCTFPPQIMLWREDQEAHICPRPECGHALTPTQVRRSDQGGSWNRARRGR